ncbi:ABC transporter permease [Dissulfuribacter thermophilus]|nr:ABC transporter permease [Dissulfuribacter thermophilus]
MNIFSAAIHWLRTIGKSRTLLRVFCIRELKGKFAGSFGGLLWVIAMPLSQILVYLFVFNTVFKVKLDRLQVGTDSFALFFLCGMFPWICFQEGIYRCCSILLENSNLITKVNFPVEILPTSALSTNFFINGAGFIIFLLYVLLVKGLTISVIFLPLIFMAFFLFSIGLGHIVAGATVFLRDIQHLLPVVLFVWFYLTPIIYPKTMVPNTFHFLFLLNPIYPFVELIRAAVFGTPIKGVEALFSLAWTFLSFFGGIFFFNKVKSSFADIL